MKLVDSKKEKLSYNQVLLGAIRILRFRGDTRRYHYADKRARMLREIGSKNVQTVQIGNSIFVGVFTPEKIICILDSIIWMWGVTL